MKKKILSILRDASEAVSGERLSSLLGISRVAVWKHIQKLKAAGYRIEGTPKGYLLQSAPDTPYSWEFPGREEQIHYFEEIDSTTVEARRLANAEAPHFTVVVAGIQRTGRGRLKRTWDSAKGGLYFTIVLRPDLPLQQSYRINFAAAVVLANLLRREYEVAAGIKWPNDILVKDKKLVGILMELEAESDRVRYVNLSIGINVNNDPSPQAPQAVSLKQLLGRELDRRRLLARFVDQFEAVMEDIEHFDVRSEWKRLTVTLGRPVRIETIRDVFEGVARDVDDEGALILEKPDGTRQRIVYGDCFHTATSSNGK